MKCSDLFMCSVKLLMGEVDGSALGGQKGWTQTGGSVLLSEDAFSGSTPLLTLPPPGTCFILSLEPHRDCTLLKSNFLSRICTWKVDMWGEKNTVMVEKSKSCERRRLLERKLNVGGTSLRLRGARADRDTRDPREETSTHHRAGALKPLQSGEAFQRFSNCTERKTIKLDL